MCVGGCGGVGVGVGVFFCFCSFVCSVLGNLFVLFFVLFCFVCFHFLITCTWVRRQIVAWMQECRKCRPNSCHLSLICIAHSTVSSLYVVSAIAAICH